MELPYTIYIPGKSFLPVSIPTKTACQVLELLEEYPIYVEFYVDGQAITRVGEPEIAVEKYGLPEEKKLFLQKNYRLVPSLQVLKENGLCPEKINLPYLTGDIRQKIIEKAEDMGGLCLTSSVQDNLEINSEDCSKGHGLAGLCRALGIERKRNSRYGN